MSELNHKQWIEDRIAEITKNKLANQELYKAANEAAYSEEILYYSNENMNYDIRLLDLNNCLTHLNEQLAKLPNEDIIDAWAGSLQSPDDSAKRLREQVKKTIG